MRCRLVLPIPALDGHFACGSGPPADQAVFQRGDKHFCRQCDNRQDHHRCEDAIRVECVSRILDHQTQALGRANVLTYHRAHQRKAKADVQAGEDPRHR